jgi:large subunit ribosomal protein L15
MKLHDLHPAPGSHTARTRVGRGIAAGKGKTAGRGTKGQKARAGGSIPPWFEGGQTPLHQRIPKLRGFKNRFKIEYEVVNIGAIGALAERGAFEGGEPEGTKPKSGKAAPPTVNQEILRAVGLVRTIKKPLKILGEGELSAALFVVADAFTKSAVAKIEGAGGTISILEVPTAVLPAIGVGEPGGKPAREPRTAAGRAAAARVADARVARVVDAEERATEAAEAEAAKATKAPKAPKSPKTVEAADEPTSKGGSDSADDAAASVGAEAAAGADGPAEAQVSADASAEADADATDHATTTTADDETA